MRRAVLTVAVTAVLVSGGLGAPPRAVAGAPAIPFDFNGDAYADLAIGAPDEGVGAKAGAGAVSVLYGSAGGVTGAGDQFWSQDSPGVKGVARQTSDAFRGDHFGTALASADYDGDGFADLAIGVPRYGVGKDDERAGAVNVLYGSAAGLTADRDQLWSEANLPGRAVDHDGFGSALTSGDFDGDGFDDLAIGIPGKKIGGIRNTGATVVVFGSADGLDADGAMVLVRTMTGALQDGFSFGRALGAGDLDADGFDDLAIGAVQLTGTLDSLVVSGDVSIFYGSAAGPMVSGSELWNQDSEGVEGEHQDGDRFGSALAATDFDADGFEDLAIGSPNQLQDSNESSVHVLYGTADGLDATASQTFLSPSKSQDDDFGDGFGVVLAAGNFDGDGWPDLAMGAPWQGTRFGLVEVAYGTPDGLDAAAAELWHQDRVGVPGSSENNDRFGAGLAAGDFDGSGEDELAIGAPGENVDFNNSGRVTVLSGSPEGLTAAGAGVWTQNSVGIRDVAERQDRWGAPLQASGR
jgi:hypothetical protein